MEPLELEATVERCREGDESAWSALVSTTLRPIYRLCASYAPTAAEAEELTQEVYFKLWENLHQYAPGSNFMAWAWRVARNLLIDSYRRCHRERSAAWLDPEIIERLPATDDPHEESLRRQRLRLVATSPAGATPRSPKRSTCRSAPSSRASTGPGSSSRPLSGGACRSGWFLRRAARLRRVRDDGL